MWLPRFVCPECRTRSTPTAEGGRFRATAARERFRAARRCVAISDAVRGAQPRRRSCASIARCAQRRTASWPRRPSTTGAADCAVWRSACRRVADPPRELRHLHGISSRRRLGATRCASLDLGAGSGWLSHRLAALGHRAVAVDALDDEVDGLGACRHYPAGVRRGAGRLRRAAVRTGQFDLVVFNGSLHYSRGHRGDAGGGAAHARRPAARWW